eukprot:scaffold426_cov319-Pavlova_lutheri.AAC.6
MIPWTLGRHGPPTGNPPPEVQEGFPHTLDHGNNLTPLHNDCWARYAAQISAQLAASVLHVQLPVPRTYVGSASPAAGCDDSLFSRSASFLCKSHVAFALQHQVSLRGNRHPHGPQPMVFWERLWGWTVRGPSERQ